MDVDSGEGNEAFFGRHWNWLSQIFLWFSTPVAKGKECLGGIATMLLRSFLDFHGSFFFFFFNLGGKFCSEKTNYHSIWSVNTLWSFGHGSSKFYLFWASKRNTPKKNTQFHSCLSPFPINTRESTGIGKLIWIPLSIKTERLAGIELFTSRSLSIMLTPTPNKRGKIQMVNGGVGK